MVIAEGRKRCCQKILGPITPWFWHLKHAVQLSRPWFGNNPPWWLCLFVMINPKHPKSTNLINSCSIYTRVKSTGVNYTRVKSRTPMGPYFPALVLFCDLVKSGPPCKLWALTVDVAVTNGANLGWSQDVESKIEQVSWSSSGPNKTSLWKFFNQISCLRPWIRILVPEIVWHNMRVVGN